MASRSCSDLSKSSQLPMAVDTGCLWLCGELRWSRFLVEESDSTLWASNGNLGVDGPEIKDLKTPAFIRTMTSSSVYRSGLPAEPGNSVSVLANGPTVANGTSSPVWGSQYGVA